MLTQLSTTEKKDVINSGTTLKVSSPIFSCHCLPERAAVFVFNYISNDEASDLAPVTGTIRHKKKKPPEVLNAQKFHFAPYLTPRLPMLPVFLEISHAFRLIDETLHGNPRLLT